MSQLFPPSLSQLSAPMKRAIRYPASLGTFEREYAEKIGLEWIQVSNGSYERYHALQATFLVDSSDGTLVDMRYMAFGPPTLMGFMEVVSRISLGKNYDQVRRISEELVRREVEEGSLSYPKESYPLLNQIFELLELFAERCSFIPLSPHYTAPPAPTNFAEKRTVEGWHQLLLADQLKMIEEVLDHEVRPFIALDAGGVNVLGLVDGKHLLISYEGACTSCHSSTGATLAYIQQILRDRVHPEIEVNPQ